VGEEYIRCRSRPERTHGVTLAADAEGAAESTEKPILKKTNKNMENVALRHLRRDVLAFLRERGIP
jgi:hypothetical protein